MPRPFPDRHHPLPLPAALVALVLAVLTALLGPGATPARAATLTEVTGFGSNPGNLQMFRYVPDGLPAGRPLVVALHGCTQSAAGFYDDTGWNSWADRYGFALLLPQQRSANNATSCFNWFQSGDTARGQGEALSVKQMVDRMTADYGSDTARVYVTGLSAGGAMTSALAAAYPDVFAGAAVVAGIPAGCATSLLDAYTCMNPGRNLSAAQWGDKVRAADPGYTGPRPVVSVWHGSADTTVAPANMTELVEQWTDVHGTDATPEVSDTVAGHPHRVYRDAAGRDVVETYSLTGMPHGQAVDPGTGADQCGIAGQYFPDVNLCASRRIAAFWGLAGTTDPGPDPDPDPDPEPTPACFTATNYAQVAAGRAHQSLGFVYANGSNQAMGLYNIFTTHTLAETAPGYFELADAGCPPQ
ncbi:hypothetical protein SRB5_03990 [Streptomyces sp. RB5]|uniref:Feruloyl esterase n=1 Tax=Streptomyces smaragdinus TaxID=2585196 RepID=A0A7K0CAW8_9ACTN|nr:PHB depolymerase family esterase [Streptomyces smaragdinus]MQY10292.1 hypothetical protein [Streptomyces smaragdinus]